MIEFGRETCGDLGAATGREWLETNGRGGFASSTIIGLNTRRYHGLLVAATAPPVGRAVLLSKLEETLAVNGERFELAANQYPGVIHPQGHQYLKRFRLDPFPVFTYEVAGVVIEKAVFMVHGESTTAVEYRVTETARAVSQLALEVRPLLAFRDYHATTRENGALNPHVELEPSLATVAPYADLPALHLAHDAAAADATGYWYRNFEYRAERERGLDFVEDLFSPLRLTFDLTLRARAGIIASTERRSIRRLGEFRQSELVRRYAVRSALPQANDLVRALVAAADQFIVTRGRHQTIIAGYHWFGDWGRDTMIALAGLALVTGRADVARGVLRAFAEVVSQGMLPNRFPDAGAEPEYNTIDATLWYFDAVRALLDYTEDYEFVRQHLYDKLTEIIDWHERGTRYGIRVDEDGLLRSGEPGAQPDVQLTWMDAKIGEWVVTPRAGKAVEIQALWYNALRVMARLAREFGDEVRAERYRRMAARCRRSFNEQFWNEAAGCLYDAVDGNARDTSLRPNQILAVSLTHSMLSRAKARRVVAAIERELLTPFGLRSLAPSDARYAGRYAGDAVSRDSVYHQGTVWAWLLGPFITAYVKVHGASDEARARATGWLEEFSAHLREAGLNQVSEIFDGDAPHTPRGCIAQAWSVAELLRAAAEDVYRLRTAKLARLGAGR
jgi:predicted glycogen debranching enzyme